MTTNNVLYTSTRAIWETEIYKENESLYYYLPFVVITWFRRSICLEFAVCQSTKAPHAVRVQNSAQNILL